MTDVWTDLRRQMPVVADHAYFDHAGVAPLPAATRDAIFACAADYAERGRLAWSTWRHRIEEARRLGAQLIGGSEDEIALIHNTTEGINLVAEGFPWKAGDNVIIFAREFPSNRYPWMNLRERGVEARVVPTANERADLDHVAEVIDERTRIVAVSWVGYATGWRQDLAALAELAHRQGALLFVDAIQGLGVIPLDAAETGVDFLAADGHKWLLGPEGAGLFYLRREHLNLLRPLGVGWNSAQDSGDFTAREFRIKDDASRYEGGTYNTCGLAGLAVSLELVLSIGVPRLGARVDNLTDELCAELSRNGGKVVSDRDPARRSGIVAFEFPGLDPQAARRELQRQGWVVNCRAGRLRVSPHAYNTLDEILGLAEAIVTLRQGFPAG